MCRFAAEHLLPGEGDDIELGPGHIHGEGGRGRVADRQTLAVGRDPITVRHAHARRGAVPGKQYIVRPVDLAEIGQLAVAGLDHLRVFELELLGDVGDPVIAEAFPGQHIDRLGPEQRPECHLDGAGVGTCDDADAVVSRQAEEGAGAVDRLDEAGLARLAAMRAAEDGVFEGWGSSRGAWRRGRRRNSGQPAARTASESSGSWEGSVLLAGSAQPTVCFALSGNLGGRARAVNSPSGAGACRLGDGRMGGGR